MTESFSQKLWAIWPLACDKEAMERKEHIAENICFFPRTRRAQGLRVGERCRDLVWLGTGFPMAE